MFPSINPKLTSPLSPKPQTTPYLFDSMHSVSKMRSFLSCHFPPPSSLTKLPPLSSAFHFRPPSPRSQHRTLYYSRTTVSLRSKPPAFASRTCCSSVPVDGGHLPPSSGEIHVIVGPMFAGKTTALLRRVQSESSNGRRVAMIKSNKDNRYGLDSVVTHDGVKMPCWALSELSTFRATIGAEAYEKLDVIGVDEAQFFEDLYDFCSNAADHDGKAVIVAGLDGDYLRRNFGSVIDIIPLADSVTKLTARCEVCGKRAFFTLRKTEETKTEVIGGADIYMPVCRQHYVDGQVVIKAARHVLESRKVQLDSSYLQAASLPN